MGKRRTRNTPRAEGEHGHKTNASHIAQLGSSPAQSSRDDVLEHDQHRAALSGKRRLTQGREQHDEAEKNAELGRERRL